MSNFQNNQYDDVSVQKPKMKFSLIEPVVETNSVVERVLTNRGIKVSDIEHYLHTSEVDILNPHLLDNLKEGATILASHIAQNDKIFVQIDSDVDGLTSSAAFINYLNAVFPHFAQTNISYRLHDGKEHGLILDTIPEDVKLVVAPDSSSNDYEVHSALKKRGVDVLVLDHHNAEKVSEDACVINNQLSGYPNKELSGVGIVYKFCCYLDELLQVHYADNFLDLVALGMIADMMDLREFETKHLIGLGLNDIRNPFFKEVVGSNSYSFRDGVTPIGVAFSVAPLMNAVIRVGTPAEKVLLFESMLDFRAYEEIPSTKRGSQLGDMETRVGQACRNCTNIKRRQTTAVDTSLEIIEQIIEEEDLLSNKILAVRIKPPRSITKSLTGLMANQLVAKYQRPVLILNQIVHTKEDSDEEYMEWEGSGRGYVVDEIPDLQSFLSDSGLVEYAEGHANALGVGVLDSNFDSLIRYANEALKSCNFTPKYNVDFIYEENEVKATDIMEIGSMEDLWGQGVARPYIAIKNLRITKSHLNLMKGTTLKITLPSNSEVSLIKFRSSEEEYESLYSELGCVTINVIGECSINRYNGLEFPQIKIKDYEIIGRTSYYF